MENATIYVKQATSNSNIQDVESLLLKSDGIERALFDTNDGEIKVEFDHQKISLQQIIGTLEAHGLHVTI
ncbi:heavy-metal-associated domain-containing protein [Bacillus sp. V5-8f]|uniref:heavy-metal-associated domain-containing protein n=1 Tax=Bacillus sp. V5-8f TaxID=2053044 RepID=UPI000C7663E6|nr:heavy-metal-associated domain-containing protein [Bacillus sp. V5-8f]PLT33624.1 hypothetical protein CUU64_10865 [Bacillus sp. V5-8f]